MTKKEFAAALDSALKAVRKEYGFTQEKMAAVLGISKKTLVEIGAQLSGMDGCGGICGNFPRKLHFAGAVRRRFG